jgi:hypothetical protein
LTIKSFIHLDNLLKTVGEGSTVYADGKKILDIVIGEYDQAVLDLTASVVASTLPFEAHLTDQVSNTSKR